MFRAKALGSTVPVTPIEHAVFDSWVKKEPDAVQVWVKSSGFSAKPGQISLIAGKDGKLSRVLFGVRDHDGFWD